MRQHVDYWCDETTKIEGVANEQPGLSYRALRIYNDTTLYGVTVFLTEEAAKAIHDELERIYPQLALPLGEGDVDALAERYAEEHAGDVGVDGPVEVWHVVEPRTTGADIAAYNSRAVDLVARAAGLIR